MAETEATNMETADVEAILDALESGSPERLAEIAESAHPGDVEQAFERLDDREREEILERLPAEILSDWAEYLPAQDVELSLNSLPAVEQREVLESLTDDDLVDFLQEVAEEDRPRYIALLPPEKQQVSRDLLRYPEETAGGRMTMAMASITDGLTVKQALDQLEGLRDDAEILSRIYVIDSENRLLGLVRLRELAFATWDTPIRSLMKEDRTAVNAMADQEEAAQMIARYDLLALPVVDDDNRLLGVITHDDALEILEEESTEDMERMTGIGGDSGEFAYLQTPVLVHFKRRFGWVLVLAFLALTSGFVLHSYEEVLTAYYVLAIYFPMVVAAGGNTGAQSATMVIRAMSLGELDSREFGRVVWKEARVGILLGLLLGACVAVQIAFLLPERFAPEDISLVRVGTVVAVALSLQILTSTLFGALLPILARMLRLDPAVVASPAITTLVDVSGSILYFSIAKVVFL